MPAQIAILEDDANRVSEMRQCLAHILPDATPIFFDNAAAMIDWLRVHLAEVALISLDHDLPLARRADGHTTDCGTGRQVADFLATLPPTCPIIVHSSNADCAAGMTFTLTNAGWPCSRVYPVDDLAWVRQHWAAAVTRLGGEGWMTT